MLNFFHKNRTNLKQVACILIASTILLQSLSSAIIIAGYAINKAYITKAFCENKDKPMMHCNGKCHLKKQLNEEHSKNPSSSPNNSKEQNELQYVDNHFKTIIVPPQFFSHIPGNIGILPPSPPSTAIFHPPKLAS